MTPERFRYCIACLGWSLRACADFADVANQTVRNQWATGEREIPWEIEDWLEYLVAGHERYPRPRGWYERNPGFPPLPLVHYGRRAAEAEVEETV